jgi:hypothetical protein
MRNTAIIPFSSQYQLSQTVFVLAATMALPVLVHLLPNINGQLSGAVLLPIFLAPMVATFLYKKHVALVAGIFAPLLNYLIMGRPTPEMVITLGFEVALFALVLSWLKNLKAIQYLAAPLSYLIASFVVAIGLSVIGTLPNPVSFWLNSTSIAVPGILLMAMANLAILRFQK